MSALQVAGLVSFAGLMFVAYFTMLHLLGSSSTGYAKLLRTVHRIAGALAIALYAAIMVVILVRLKQTHVAASPHILLVMVLSSLMLPLLVAKIVIVEKYPELRNRLFTIGTVLLIFGYAIFAMALVALKLPQPVSTEARAEFTSGRQLFASKCSKCHRLEKPLTVQKTADEWRVTVSTMHKKDLSWISGTEAEEIVRFLKTIGAEGERD